MSDYSGKVHRDVGGDKLTAEAGGVVAIGNMVFTVNAAGKAIVTGVPTADPLVAGQLWNNSGVLTVSTGA
jgi:hypothetical protein